MPLYFTPDSSEVNRLAGVGFVLKYPFSALRRNFTDITDAL